MRPAAGAAVDAVSPEAAAKANRNTNTTTSSRKEIHPSLVVVQLGDGSEEERDKKSSSSSSPRSQRRPTKNTNKLTQKCCLLVAALVLLCTIGISILILLVATSNNMSTHFITTTSYLPSFLTTQNPTQNKHNRKEEPKLHLVFSTDCSLYQHWQSYALYYSAVQVKQRGKITRIISGCTEQQMKQMIQWHKQNVLPLSQEKQKFTLHFTPDYDHPILKTYVYVNKPFGLLHYFENYDEGNTEEGFSVSTFHLQTQQTQLSNNRTTTRKLSKYLNSDDIIAVIDPDMVFLRPLTHDFTPSTSFQPVYAPGNDPSISTDHNVTTVQHGHPFAPLYAVGDAWRYFNLKYITKSDTSPALNFTQEEALSHFAVGSPYIGTVRDMYALTPLWLDSVATVREEFPEHISEMYSYIIGAADANLPHHILQNFMISGPGGSLEDDPPNEGWSFLPHIPADKICPFAAKAYKLDAATVCSDTQSSTTNDNYNSNWKCLALQKLPNFLHFCQTYHVGDWFWNKWHVPKDYLTCESPIFATPPNNLGSSVYANYQQELGNRRKRNPINSYNQAQNAFMICAMSSVLQEAALYFKNHSCNATNANLDLSLNLYEIFTPPSSSSDEEEIQQQEGEEEESKSLLERNETIQNPNLHLVFQTDCSSKDHWKAYALYFSAVKVKQKGKITRIVSGCMNDEHVEEMIQWHTTYIVPLSNNDVIEGGRDKFTIHFTPNYDHKVFHHHKFVNIPFGILHFLEHYDDSDNNSNCISSKARKIQRASNPSLDSENNPINEDEPLQIDQINGGRNTHLDIQPFLKFNANDVLIILDVNMIFLQPITNVILTPDGGTGIAVQHHQPLGAKYNIGTLWKKFDLKYITGSEESPALDISEEDAAAHYTVGPPYLGSMADMHELLIQNWLTAAHAVPDEYREFLNTLPFGKRDDLLEELHSELYSYVIGAAHAQLPHSIVETLIMTDDADFLELVDTQETCDFASSTLFVSVEEVCSDDEKEESNWKCQALRQMPNFLNYRQGYTVDDKWWFDEKYFPTNYFSCDSTVTISTSDLQSSKLGKSNVFSICALTKVLQESLEFFRSEHCKLASGGSMQKDLTLKDIHHSEKKKHSEAKKHEYLTEEQLGTVKAAKLISITYDDFTGGKKDHPHKGALDEYGKLGYVHSPTAIRMNPPQLQLPDNEEEVCRDDDELKVLRKVKVSSSEEEEQSGNIPRAKIFCTAYTIESNHDKVPAIRETWGQRCDGFMIPSTVTNTSLDTVNILHLGEENYWNIWQKVRSVWAYIYDNYYNDYDWFHLAGEDQYVVVENLRKYVESETIRSAANGGKEPLTDWAQEFQTPLYLGRRLAEHARLSLLYNHGGPGYTLNKVYLWFHVLSFVKN
jgi:hypothetical protein